MFLADFMFVNCRYKRFEKAFLLAVDIGAKDLFMVSCSPIFFFSVVLLIKLKSLLSLFNNSLLFM